MDTIVEVISPLIYGDIPFLDTLKDSMDQSLTLYAKSEEIVTIKDLDA